MKGKRYSKEEWEAAKHLKNLGLTWIEVARRVGRSGDRLGRSIRQFEGNYDAYLASYQREKKAPARQTEQLQFVPPEMPKAPRKIQIKSMSEKEWNDRKLAMASKQARIVSRFVAELKDAGFQF